MTLDQLQAIEIDAGEDDADPLAGLTMVSMKCVFYWDTCACRIDGTHVLSGAV
jgi:hypothetical protein